MIRGDRDMIWEDRDRISRNVKHDQIDRDIISRNSKRIRAES